MNKLVLGLVTVIFALAFSYIVVAKDASIKNADATFDKKVAPLFAQRCLECHGGDRPRGGLDLTRKKTAMAGGDSGAVIVPGSAKTSLLWQKVSEGRMPPKKPLSDAEKTLLKNWIDTGAGWGSDPIDPFAFTTDSRAGYDWWSLQPVQRPALPKIENQAWPRNAIDHFILAKLDAEKLAPSSEADRRVLIRRLYFDLIGLPPMPKQVASFVQDTSADAYGKLVDRLLASPHYGERWARHWLDVVRFGESNGFEHDEIRRDAWPYRDWVIQALNDDMPYDQFARLQLAGDVLLPDDPGGIIATGFLTAGGYDTVGQKQQSVAMKAVVRQDELEDITGTVGQTFLGLTVNCARCHDHKFDPVRQKEYYQLTAALAGVRHGRRDLTSANERAAHAKRQAALEEELEKLVAQVKKLEAPIRKKILEERREKSKEPISIRPPLAQWEFSKGVKDQSGSLDVRLHGDAKIDASGLRVHGKDGYAASAPLKKEVKARTMAAWVKLSNLQQRGGAVMSLQTLNGQTFDAIVFGEKEPSHWLAGSDFFRRTKSFRAFAEKQAVMQPVHIAIVYAADGTITAYRNGKLYGTPYKSAGPVAFAAGKAQVIFGLRHSPVRPGRMLDGTILKAELYDRPLSPSEVAALAGTSSDYVSNKEIVARLNGDAKKRRKQTLEEIDRIQNELKTPLPKKTVYALAPSNPGVSHVLLRGNPAQKGDVVKPGGVAALAGLDADFGLPADAPDAERRKKLAEWITHPKNPLFARVIVNRLWHYHFGAGIVNTPNDLGFNGGRPSHPKLLNWLAAELIEKKYSLKALHKLIVMSATYRQSSQFNPTAAKIDADNRLLWRKSPTRLEAEAVRDSILFVAGQLNTEMGGPGYDDFKLSIRGATHYYAPIDPIGFEFNRRTIYRTWARSGRSKLLDTLDCPDPSTTAPKRLVTTTPLQALTLLNSSFVLRMADHFANRITKEAGDDVKRQIIHAYKLAYNRRPSSKEIAVAQQAVDAHGLAILCRAILNSNEFIYID